MLDKSSWSTYMVTCIKTGDIYETRNTKKLFSKQRSSDTRKIQETRKASRTFCERMPPHIYEWNYFIQWQWGRSGRSSNHKNPESMIKKRHKFIENEQIQTISHKLLFFIKLRLSQMHQVGRSQRSIHWYTLKELIATRGALKLQKRVFWSGARQLNIHY